MKNLLIKSVLIFTVCCLFLFTSLFEIQGSGKVTSKVNLPVKWEQYFDLEQLQRAKQIEVIVPNVLPKGYILDKTEYYDKTIRVTYLNENKSIIFTQSPALTPFATKETSELDTVIRWSTVTNNFELKGVHAKESDLTIIKDSLHPISNIEDSITVSFEIISCADRSQMYSSKDAKKNRSFEIYTPAAFKKNKKKCVGDQDIASSNSIIIGLFSGQKGSSGHAIHTSQVILDNNQLTVKFYEIKPSPDSIYLTVITYPYQYIEVQIPPEQKVSSVQFITDKGQAVANIAL